MKIIHILISLATLLPSGLLAEDVVNVDLPDETRAAILRNVADIFGLNIKAPDGLPEGRVTLCVKSATWQELFGVCLQDTGYTYEVIDEHNLKIVKGKDKPIVPFLTQKLAVEVYENQGFRRLLIDLVNDGTIKCHPDRKQSLVDFIQNFDNRPSECLVGGDPKGSGRNGA
jgi:hypothetical protein